MIPFSIANHFVNIVSGQSSDQHVVNEDLACHLRNTPAPARDAWPLRWLPAFIRNRLKARMAARKYEQTLINLWEKSPHLLEDIGVVLDPVDALEDHLIPAPARVFEHVALSGAIQAERTAATALPKPAAAPEPFSTPTLRAPNLDLLRTLPAGAAA